ncbi:MAG TPA: GAF domain-containing protein [Castellaniella sp.]|nr:GAF domain-containing protein [Castellaniella sp.]
MVDSSTAFDVLEGEAVRLLHRDAERQALEALRDRLAGMPDGADKARASETLSMALTVKERLEQHQQRERGLMAVIETAQDLTRIVDIDEVLRVIVRRARALLGCDVGYLSVYDAARRDFYVRATDGAFSERFCKIRVGLDTGVCGYVARHRSPYSSSDYAGDSRFDHSRFIDDAMRGENIASILGVPLLSAGEVSGVLFVGDRYVRTYTAWEISILSTLGAQASVAIGNARLFEQARDALARAEDTNERLSRQTADTRAAAETHEQLTALVARGGDLPDLCDMLARRLGGRVAVCDEGGREIVAAHAERGVEAPAPDGRWIEDAAYAALGESRRTGRSVTYRKSRTVCAIVGGEGPLGGLVLQSARPLGEVATRTFERGAMVTGVVLLLKAQRALSLVSDAPAVLHGLIHGPSGRAERFAQQAEKYGVDIRQPMRLLLIRTGKEGCASLCRQLRDRLGSSSALFDDVGDSLVVLANAMRMEPVRAALEAGLRRHRDAFLGVVGDVVERPDGLPKSFERAERCLDLLDALDRRGELFDESRLALYVPLFNRADTAAIEGFFTTTLGKLYAGQAAHDTRRAVLAGTLLAYLDCGYNAAEAARRLSLHINTLRQRLESVDALLAGWRDAGRALEIHVALRLWRLREPQRFAVQPFSLHSPEGAGTSEAG